MVKWFNVEGYAANSNDNQTYIVEYYIPQDSLLKNIYIYWLTAQVPAYVSLYEASSATATIGNMLWRQVIAAFPYAYNLVCDMFVPQGRMCFVYNTAVGAHGQMLRWVFTMQELEDNVRATVRSYPGRVADRKV